MIGRTWTIAALAAAMSAAAAGNAAACPVCFGAKGHPVTEGAASSVLFMVFVTYGLLIFGFGGFLTIWFVRARQLSRAGLRLSTAAGCAVAHPALRDGMGHARVADDRPEAS